MDLDEWGPSQDSDAPSAAASFPTSGVNALAPIWKRGVAFVIDAFVVFVPASVVTVIVALATMGLDADAMQESATVTAWFTGSTFVLRFLYETVAVTLWGQTLGKWLLGVRVARLGNGRCPLWWEAGIRVALPALVAAIPHPIAQLAVIALYGAAFLDPLRRTIPDRAAGTVVVRAR